MRDWMKRYRPLYSAACIVWFFLVTSPAWAVWLVSLAGVALDLRFNNRMPLMTIPGWTKNELTYIVPTWRPF